jgi:hypothetical protein
MPLMRIGQQRFLTFEDEQKQLAELEEIYARESAWRKSESLLALARWQAMRAGQRPRAPWQDRVSSVIPAAIPAAATSLEQRAVTMRRELAGWSPPWVSA